MATEENNANTFRAIIATDNHLGYLEKDPIRGQDSFIAFEEIFKEAIKRKVDCVLLGGDLFHHNKPSRHTMHRTIQILRKYCLGDMPVRVQVLSDQSQNFKAADGRVNYEDPNYAVGLPVFTIHGNHDDPLREGHDQSLSAVDLLSACNLVNYFGKHENLESIDIYPILLAKGTTKVAIYGLGNIRDERLNRMFSAKKIKFLRPKESQRDRAQWFNIFIIHQNRDYGRGAKNCIHDHMLPDFLDLVLWGHEHECVIDPVESTTGNFHVTQPGSSVATSLVEGEARKKHVGLLEVRGDQFRLQPIALKTVRKFVVSEIRLSDLIDPEIPNLKEEVKQVLTEKIEEILHELERSSESHDSDEDAPPRRRNSSGSETQCRNLPLVRLKVDHTDFFKVTLQNQRFGAQFVGRVANPDTLLLFRRTPRPKQKKAATEDEGALLEPLRPSAMDGVQMEDIFKDTLQQSEIKLQILSEQNMIAALDMFVSKHCLPAISDAVKEEVERTQKMLHQERNVKAVQDMKVLVSKQIEKRREKARKKEERLRKADEARAATAHDSEDDFPASSSASALNATDQSLAQKRATAKTVVSSSSSSSSSRDSRNAGIRDFFQPSPSQTSVASVRGKRGRAPAKRKSPMPAKRKTRRAKATAQQNLPGTSVVDMSEPVSSGRPVRSRRRRQVIDVSLEDEDDPFESIDENWGAPALNSASFESAPSTISRGRRRNTRARIKRR